VKFLSYSTLYVNETNLAVYVVSIISHSIGLMWSTKLPNYLAESGVKSSGYLLFFFLEISLYEVRLVRIKEQIDEKRSTVGTHRSTNSVEKMYVMLKR
jgi:hypothetical protein